MGKGKQGGMRPYHYTQEFRDIANAALERFNARRPHLPKCGASRKSDGGACQNLPLGNGRCRLHGGKTPSGDNWHRPQWPDGSSPEASRKLNAKLERLQKEARERAFRLSEMSDEERERHEQWHRARPLGTAAQRAAKRLDRERASEVENALLEKPSTSLADDPEYQSLVGEIADLKRLLARLETNTTDQAQKDVEVFG
ncbi:MAG: HGGxSTG domain-containing protein [Pseudomonadota bacterium]|nr:HGGxSTG domain-containing protein [Pseudomonadota bacterium]